MRVFRRMMLHMCVICSGICIMAKVLDWYNPFMNFEENIAGIQIFLYAAVILLGLIGTGSEK